MVHDFCGDSLALSLYLNVTTSLLSRLPRAASLLNLLPVFLTFNNQSVTVVEVNNNTGDSTGDAPRFNSLTLPPTCRNTSRLTLWTYEQITRLFTPEASLFSWPNHVWLGSPLELMYCTRAVGTYRIIPIRQCSILHRK